MGAVRRKRATETSAFGSPGRIAHDSSRFYKSKLYAGQARSKKVPYVENPVPESILNTVLQKRSEDMSDLPDCSVHLMVTSPPYNVGKEYDENLTLEEYLDFLKRVWKETLRVLVPGGRACINVANLGRKPYIPLHIYITRDMLDLGFLMRGEIIWNKGASASPSTAWGTWKSASNPVLRDVHEYILVFCKDTFTRGNPHRRKSTIAKEEFLEFTKSVWSFPAVSARQVGHPAPFPEELPRRCIELYTFEGEVVLDPFVGSGTTCVAAVNSGRNFVAYEVDPQYVKLAKKRIKKAMREKQQRSLLSGLPVP